MTTFLRCLLASLLLLPVVGQARPEAENQRIEYVLAVIRDMTDAKFVRSGKEYGGAEAVDHLRMKLDKAGEKVQTAEQFIEGIASKSYLTGKAYQIKFNDGRVVNAGPFLTEKLKAHGAGAAKK
jgi:hypothetical protein